MIIFFAPATADIQRQRSYQNPILNKNTQTVSKSKEVKEPWVIIMELLSMRVIWWVIDRLFMKYTIFIKWETSMALNCREVGQKSLRYQVLRGSLPWLWIHYAFPIFWCAWTAVLSYNILQSTLLMKLSFVIAVIKKIIAVLFLLIQMNQ